MKGLFIPDITAEMFRNGCLESIEELMARGEMFDVEVPDTNVGKKAEYEKGYKEGYDDGYDDALESIRARIGISRTEQEIKSLENSLRFNRLAKQLEGLIYGILHDKTESEE